MEIEIGLDETQRKNALEIIDRLLTDGNASDGTLRCARNENNGCAYRTRRGNVTVRCFVGAFIPEGSREMSLALANGGYYLYLPEQVKECLPGDLPEHFWSALQKVHDRVTDSKPLLYDEPEMLRNALNEFRARIEQQ